jgi:hypothetical protein
MANAGVRWNGRPLRWMAKDHLAGSTLMIRLIGRVVATVKAAGVTCASLTLRYHRMYSIFASDASKSGLCTEFTSG